MTPSRVTNSSTMTFLMTEFLQHLATSQEAVIRRWAFRRAQRHASFLFCSVAHPPKREREKRSQKIEFYAGGGLCPSFHCKTREMPRRGSGGDENGVRPRHSS